MDIYNPILSSSVYKKTSLAESLQEINDPKIIVTDHAVINIVVKYFFAYFYPESISQKVDFSDIQKIFERWTKYCIASRGGDGDKNIKNISNNQELNFYEKFEQTSYGLSMLWDVAPSAAIVKDIITRKIDPAPFEGRYVWLDLGTGTGVLLLAQCIQALRNDFKSIQNIGIEKDQTSVKLTDNIAKLLWLWKIVQWDTTQEDIYNTLSIDGPITFISNENIPTTWVSMSGKNDPFHQNNRIIYQTPFSAKLLEHTQTFPKAIAMTLSIQPVINQQFVWAHANKFFIENLSKFEDTLKSTEWFTYEEGRTIFNNIYTNGIALDGKIVPMHEIGKHITESGKVNKIPWRRHRRSDNMATDL